MPDSTPSQLNVFVADIKDLLATALFMASLGVLCSITSCTKEQQAQVKTVLQAADKGAQVGCILFPALPLSAQSKDVAEDVCLGADEVRQAVADYQRGKAARQAASASAPPPPAPPSLASSSSPSPPPAASSAVPAASSRSR